MLGREGHIGQDIGLAFIHQRSELWPAGAELVRDVAPDLLCTFLVGLVEGLPDCRGNDSVLALGHMSQRIAHPMNAASLPCRIEDPRDRGFQAGMRIGDHQLETLQPAAFETTQELGPECLSL